MVLEDTARYAGLLLAPAESFGLWPRVFLPFGQKNNLSWFLANFRQLWCPVVTLVTLKEYKNSKKNPKKKQKKISEVGCPIFLEIRDPW